MKEEGVDISRNTPKLLTKEIIDEASLVVMMCCSVQQVCPKPMIAQMKKKLIDWQVGDTIGKPIEEIRGIRDMSEKNTREISEQDFQHPLKKLKDSTLSEDGE